MATGESLNIYELDKFNPEDFYIPLTFSVADYRDISTRNGNFSKTVELPSTKKNDSLLGHSFDITTEGFFDRNKKQKAFIEKDGIVYLDGFMQLKSVELKDGRPYKYKVILYSSLAEWANLIKGSIKDLDYSSITYNKANVKSSWDNSGLEDEYVFPLINYNNLTGSDYTTDIKVEDFLPGVFVYYILKKSFEKIGYQLKPGVFYDKRISNLFIPWCVSDIRTSEEVLIQNSGGMTLKEPGYLFDFSSSAGFRDIVFDTYNANSNTDNFDLSNGSFTAPFDCTVSANLTMVVTNFQTIFDNLVEVAIRKVELATGTTTILFSQIENVEAGKIFNLNLENLDLLEGDIIKVSMKSGNLFNTNLSPAFPNDSIFDVDITSAPLVDGDIIGIGDNLPDIEQINLVKSIIQMFNLFHVTDEKNKTVEFLTRDDFYKAISESDDWTEKVDYSKPIEIEQLDKDLSRDLKFKYTDDSSDNLHVNFKSNYGINYGDYTETLDNEFLKDSKQVADIPFAVSIGSGTLDQANGNTIPLPWILTNYRSAGDPVSVVDRILIYEGLIPWNWTFEGVSENNIPFSYFTKKGSSFNDISLSFRSYRNFNPVIEQKDFGLFERFYKNQIKMFNQSRLTTMYLKLSAVDILNLDFRKPKYIKGVYYYLNKIEDYKTGTDETVKVELINLP